MQLDLKQLPTLLDAAGNHMLEEHDDKEEDDEEDDDVDIDGVD